MKELIDKIIMHQRETLKLMEQLNKRYGIEVISVTPEHNIFIKLNNGNYSKTYFNGASILIRRGFKKVADELGEEINGEKIHGDERFYRSIYNGCEICTVTNGGKRFLKEKKRNNKYTRESA